MRYLQHFPEYVWRCFLRIDFICAGVVAVGYFFFAEHFVPGLGKAWIVTPFVGLSFLWASYAVYRQERIMRSNREQQIRLEARISSSAWNLDQDLARDEVSLKISVLVEIWTDVDVDTKSLWLNIIGTQPDRKLWEFWKPRTKRLRRLGIQNANGYEFRRALRSDQKQPHRAVIEFRKWRERPDWDGGAFTWELVLETGRPAGIWRTLMTDDLFERGSTDPK